MIRIELKSEKNRFRPGDVLEGEAVWEFSTVPKSITVSLDWETEGKGDSDGEVCVEQSWSPQSQLGRVAFRWTLPEGPVSLNGKLFSVQWLLRIWSVNPDQEAEMKIVISHLTTPVINRQVDSLSVPIAFGATKGAANSKYDKSPIWPQIGCIAGAHSKILVTSAADHRGPVWAAMLLREQIYRLPPGWNGAAWSPRSTEFIKLLGDSWHVFVE